MATLSISTLLIAFLPLLVSLEPSGADPNSYFLFPELGKDPKFDSVVALFGDAKVVNGGSAVQLSSAGRVIYKKPIKLVEGKPQKLVSFSTSFSFSVSPENGDGLAFVMVPSAFNGNVFYNGSFGLLRNGKFKAIAVKFNTLIDAKNSSLVKLLAGIDVGSLVSAKVRNTSAINLALDNGNKLLAWIDYEAGSKRLEVRLSKFGHLKPSDPLFWYPIDLSNMWEDHKSFVGFSAVSKNSSRPWFIHSWNFEQRHIPQWMHSEPLDPNAFAKNSKPLKCEKKKDCLTTIVPAFISGVACGALVGFTLVYLWTIFGKRLPVVPEEFSDQPVDFEYKKVKVVVDKAIEDGKN
ncbi:hypothetical protein UlMin_000319 [Ulmus minor]